jgi:hypothetical protein
MELVEDSPGVELGLLDIVFHIAQHGPVLQEQAIVVGLGIGLGFV